MYALRLFRIVLCDNCLQAETHCSPNYLVLIAAVMCLVTQLTFHCVQG